MRKRIIIGLFIWAEDISVSSFFPVQIQTLTFPVDVVTTSTEQSVEMASSPWSKHKCLSSLTLFSESKNHKIILSIKFGVKGTKVIKYMPY